MTKPQNHGQQFTNHSHTFIEHRLLPQSYFYPKLGPGVWRRSPQEPLCDTTLRNPQITTVCEGEPRWFLVCRFCPGSRGKRYCMFPSHKTIISIRTRDTRCLIFTCKIPANLPYQPRRGSPRWPWGPRSMRPDSIRFSGLQVTGTLLMLSA
jgi:hypothetical protein